MHNDSHWFQGVFFSALLLGFHCLPLHGQDDAMTAYNNGVAAASKGDLDGAIADFNQAIALHPQFPYAYLNRGVAKCGKGDFDGAIADFTQNINFNANDADAYDYRGNAKCGKGDLDGAIADFDQAIKISPKYDTAYNNRGLAKSNKGDFDGAIADYSLAIQINPRFADAYSNRGFAKGNKGDFDGAIADCSQAIALNPGGLINAYLNRGAAKWRKGDFDGSIADYNQAIEINPRYANAYYNRGISKDSKGDHQGAVDDYNKAISLARSQESNSASGPPSAQPGTGKGVELGTGFFVTTTGYILTDFHVVKGASTIRVKIGSSIVPASLVAKDANNDIVLLKIDGTYTCLPLGDSNAAPLGQTVFTVGFPKPELQGLSPKLTKGEISSLAGMQDDPRMFQVSVPVQPGNSGGCLVDESGNVVGLIEATLSTVETAKQSGDLLQNVNYATKINYAKTLLDTVQEAKSGLMPIKTAPAPFTDQVKTVEEATVFIIAGS